MKSVTVSIWAFVLFLLSGCGFEMSTPDVSNENVNVNAGQHGYLALLKASGDFTLSEEELEAQVTQLLNNVEFFGRGAALGAEVVITGSNKLPISGGVIASRSAYARSSAVGESEESPIEIYIFSTEDADGTEGYVLASNDMRLGIVLAVVDGGSLEDQPEWWNDIVFEGIGDYMDYIVDLYDNIDDEEIRRTIQNPVLTSNSRSVFSGSGSNNNISGKGLIHHWYPNAANVRSAAWSWTEGYEARTDKNGERVLTNWHQRYPYNFYVNGTHDAAKKGEYVAGCGPVAMAQLMAIWGMPTQSKIVNFTYDWKQMRGDFNNSATSGAKSVAYLMYELGRHASSKYTKNGGTSTLPKNIISGLKKMGYKTPGSFSSYSIGTVRSSIKAGRPVIAIGYSGKKTFLGISTYQEGHAWLIDGVRTMSYIENLVDGTGWSWSNWDFIYCNPGWGASYNSWYAAGIFDFRTGLQSHASRSGVNDYYQYNVQILPNVYY